MECILDGLEYKPDLLLFSEHWIKSVEMSFVKLNGYGLVSSFCRTELGHGGTCIYVADSYTFREDTTVCDFSVEGVIEVSCAVSLNLKMVIVCMYRRGVGCFETFMETLEIILNYIFQKYVNFKIIVGGDFNINLLDVNNNCTVGFLDLLNTFNLFQCIFEATRVTDQSSTLIDNIFYNSENNYKSYVLSTALSDHKAQILCVGNTVCERESCASRQIFSKGKLGHFKSEVEQIDWSEIYQSKCVNRAYNSFLQTMTSLSNRIFVSKKCINRRPL